MREVIIDGVRYVPAISKQDVSGSIAGFITKHRKHLNMSQVGAAAALGIEPGRMHRLEAGSHMPTLSECKRMCAYYGMTMDDFAARVGDENTPPTGHEKR